MMKKYKELTNIYPFAVFFTYFNKFQIYTYFDQLNI